MSKTRDESSSSSFNGMGCRQVEQKRRRERSGGRLGPLLVLSLLTLSFVWGKQKNYNARHRNCTPCVTTKQRSLTSSGSKARHKSVNLGCAVPSHTSRGGREGVTLARLRQRGRRGLREGDAPMDAEGSDEKMRNASPPQPIEPWNNKSSPCSRNRAVVGRKAKSGAQLLCRSRTWRS